MENNNFPKKIIVVGGGLIGVLCSMMLKRNAYEVHYIHSERFSLSNRTYALSPSIIKWLKSFNLSKQFLASLNSVRAIEVFKSVENTQLNFNSNEIDEPALAYMVKEHSLLSEFKSKLVDQTIDSYDQPKSLKIFNGDQSVGITLGDIELKSSLLIACDGAKSPIRDQLSIEKKTKDFKQTALVFEFETSKDYSSKAFQFFLGDSILAILPIKPKLMSVVWSCDNNVFERMQSLNDASFKKELIAIVGDKFGKVELISKREHFPLLMTKVSSFFQKRVLLMGDAAHSIHPLAGQGLNLGIRDIIELERNIKKSNYLDLGLSGFLRQYERSRRADIQQFSLLTSGLQWIYSRKSKKVNYLIAKSMNFIEHSDFIKNKLIKRAIS